MKKNILKLDNPCNEKWENMKPNEKGNYCNLCSKNVVDFTQLNQIEISHIVKKSENRICARLTHSQLNTPLLNLERNFKINIPKYKVAAGLALITSLTIGQNVQTKNNFIKNEFVQGLNKTLNSKIVKPNQKKPDQILNNIVIFKGKVVSKKTGKPVKNAKITFITSEKVLSSYSLNNGTFIIEIPRNLVNKNNVIRVSFNDIKKIREEKLFSNYGEKDFILTIEELKTEYLIRAEPELIYLGQIGIHTGERKPIVINSGIEIKYSDYVNALLGKKSSCNLENKDYMYFEPKFAIAIYGEKAKDGLYILNYKIKKK